MSKYVLTAAQYARLKNLKNLYYGSRDIIVGQLQVQSDSSDEISAILDAAEIIESTPPPGEWATGLVDFIAGMEGQNGDTTRIVAQPASANDYNFNQVARMDIAPGKNLGADRRLMLPGTKAFASFYLMPDEDFNTIYSVKGPGLAAQKTSKADGGQGGGGAGGDKSHSNRTQYHGVSGKYLHLGGGHEVYHRDSKNWPHGETTWWGADGERKGVPDIGLTKNRWTHIELMTELNDRGEDNGRIMAWNDGKLVLEEEGYNFTDNPDHENLSFWLDYWCGGSKPNELSNNLTMYIADLSCASTREGLVYAQAA